MSFPRRRVDGVAWAHHDDLAAARLLRPDAFGVPEGFPIRSAGAAPWTKQRVVRR